MVFPFDAEVFFHVVDAVARKHTFEHFFAVAFIISTDEIIHRLLIVLIVRPDKTFLRAAPEKEDKYPHEGEDHYKNTDSSDYELTLVLVCSSFYISRTVFRHLMHGHGRTAAANLVVGKFSSAIFAESHRQDLRNVI